jgi:hypothetical protein
MFRVLLDHNVPAKLRTFLTPHYVRTAAEEGWGQLPDNDLIRRAEAAAFDVLVTCDQNIEYQQNLKQQKIALVVLGSNIWPAVRRHAGKISGAIDNSVPGSLVFIAISRPPRTRGLRR